MLTTIRLDSKGDLVKVAEYLLNYAPLKEATSIYDSLFMEAVKEWQVKNELDADGIIGPKTWTKIADTAPTCSTSKNKKSVYTCAIQTLLGGLDVDGVYGTKTKQAVAAFQSASGLKADGVCGPKTWSALIVGKVADTTPTPTQPDQQVTDDKVINNCVHYLQWDSKWKKVMFSSHGDKNQNIGNSGCGPSSMAMIMATWIDPNITPVEMCKLAVERGHRSYNSGTNWSFFKDVFTLYEGFEKYITTKSVETLKAALREGALAVCSMNSNDNCFWTKGGHYIVARGCDNTYIYANDPNNKTVPRKQAADKFQKCMKNAFIFWPINKVQEPEPEKKTESSVINNQSDLRFDVNPDGAIIDISKWQGNIDFKTLKPKVGLVIARASCGSDKDVKIDEYAQAMIENRIPFGVYCYSYAGTVEKARDEAQKMVSYVEKYQPLFYIMDAEEARVTNEAIKAFADELHKQTKRRIGCYVAHNRYNTYKYDTVRDLFNITWIPRYGKNDGTIEGATKPAYECDLWQYTSTAKIDGINGSVDKNITMKEDRDLKWFLTE